MKARYKHSLPIFEHSSDNPEERTSAFIAQGRRFAARAGISFEEMSWEVSRRLAPRDGRSSQEGERFLHFTKLAGMHQSGELLWPSIADFAKAYCAHFIGTVQFTALADRRDAFRALGAALGDEPIEACTIAHLDAAVATLRYRSGYGLGAAKNRAVQLELIAEFLDQNGMVRADLGNWLHGCSVPMPPAGSAGAEFEANAALRLPSPKFLASIPKMFARATRTSDILVASICLLMRFMPSRVSQVIDMQEELTSIFEEGGRKRILVALPGSKGSAPRSVLLPWVMTPVAEFIFERMHRITAEPRAAKRWYDHNPDQLYLPAGLEHLRTRELLTTEEASKLLGIDPCYLTQFAKKNGMAVMPRKGREKTQIAFQVVERHILDQLELMMHRAGGESYHPLMLLKWRSLTSTSGGSPCMFEPLRYDTVCDSLTPRRFQVGIFSKLGIDPSGSIRGNSHSLRHQLTTDAVRGGLSDEDMTEWFGRADPRWTRTYDHTTNADIREPLSGVAGVFFGKPREP